jgi:hypothetical protein
MLHPFREALCPALPFFCPLRRTAREFAEREIAPRMLELDEREEFSYELTLAMGDLGLFGIIVSPELGGHA